MVSYSINILLLRGVRILSVAAVIDLFTTANKVAAALSLEINYKLQFIDLYNQEAIRSLYPTIEVANPSTTSSASCIVIPAFDTYDMRTNIEHNAAFIPWIQQLYNQQSNVLCLCTGTFLAAASGILNNKIATTHIDAATALNSLFPNIHVVHSAVCTECDGIYTSGGATSSFIAKLRYVHDTMGKSAAIEVAKIFAIDLDRASQLHFERMQIPNSCKDALIKKLQDHITENYQDIKSIDDAIKIIPISRRSLARKFKAETGMTPIKFLQMVKIGAAKKLLEHTDEDITSIMLQSGYMDIKSFRQLFKQATGLSPSKYRNKYQLK